MTRFWIAALILLAAPAQAEERPFVNVAKMFGDLIPYNSKLIETEAVPLDNGLPSTSLCLIAAVRLPQDSTTPPPKIDRTRPRYAQFGGDWKPTPMVGGPKGRDIRAACAPFLRSDRFDEALETALASPGNFYIRDFTGTLLQVYAPQQRIAVSIRLAQRK
ncbi:hypothetical protein EGN72_15100 [Pseudorhodobacter sp. E13]|uniref:hypothetical protein n=1 Tax=Pseudorhodobacter sp. E13 TaxID=2487931 RepID=UPI000F8E0EDC|nr:hypothetical protein [Pseudorhodobacter sp. E13]RUS59269.1 hypothetical protein EGN72_15100 [Pseudorhodobacter sp. E13]